MKKILSTFLFTFAVFGLNACDNRVPEQPAKEITTTTTTTTTTTPAGTVAKTEVAASVNGTTLGVVECDVFLSKYEKCILEKVPEAARPPLKEQLGQNRQTWSKVAATPEGKLSLPAICTVSLDAAKQSMSAYGCEF